MRPNRREASWSSLSTATSGPARCWAGRACTCCISWARPARRSSASSSTSRASRGSRILVDLLTNENFRPWFLGINPRGLVPVLVHDGAVHIESNDIIQYLEKTFPGAEADPGRPRERGRGAAQARGRPASRSAHLELPLRVQPARPAEARRDARRATPPTAPAPCRARRIATSRSRSSSGSAPPRKASPTSAARTSAQKFRAEFDALDSSSRTALPDGRQR